MTEHQEERHGEYGAEERVSEHSGTNHSMAIGFYIAAIVLIYGVTIALAGLLSSSQQANANIGFNVNLWWGLIMVLAGCVILGMTFASPRRRAATNTNKAFFWGPAYTPTVDAGPINPRGARKGRLYRQLTSGIGAVRSPPRSRGRSPGPEALPHRDARGRSRRGRPRGRPGCLRVAPWCAAR
jgi:hypothetical protein